MRRSAKPGPRAGTKIDGSKREAAMDEVVIKAGTLDDRAVRAKASEKEAEDLIKEFEAFLRSRVARYAYCADDAKRDEMHGTAMLAFFEAIKKYEPTKGHFLPFANVIVCGRLIDYNRRLGNRASEDLPLDDEDDEQERESAQSAAIAELSIRRYEAERRHADMVEEIEQLKAELSSWGLTMATLVEQSPKHSRLREEYKAIVEQILGSPDVIQTIQVKRYFPQKAIGIITGIPQKKLERARNFILASIIIKMGDYEILSEYVAGGR